jgi:hypothetical protein
VANTPEEKICAVCGRPFSWRRKWARVWDEVRYCSEHCRRARRNTARGAVTEAIEALLDRCRPGASICPSEAARIVWPDDWRAHMEEVREVARLMMHDGRLEITQKGRSVSSANFSGPVRLRRPTR